MATPSLACQEQSERAHQMCCKTSCPCACHLTRNLFLTRLPDGRKKAPFTHRADAQYDAEGRRLCPGCGGILEKKNPHGPGRYPDTCSSCRATS